MSRLLLLLALMIWTAAPAVARAQDPAAIQAAVNEGQRLIGSDPARAEPLLRSAAEQAQALWGLSSPDAGIITLLWGEALAAQNRHGDAEPVYRRALLMLNRSVEPGHPYLGRGLNDLSEALLGLSRDAEALTTAQQALAIWSAIEGETGEGALIAASNAAVALKGLGRFAEAEPLYRRVLAAREGARPVDDLKLALSLNNLAVLLVQQDRAAEAEPILRRAVQLRENRLGPRDPLVGQTLTQLAGVLHGVARLDAAEAMQRRALTAFEGRGDSIDAAVALTAYADILISLDRLEEAEATARLSQQMRERVFPAQSVDVADGLTALGEILMLRGRAGEATPLLTRAVAMNEALRGADHPALLRPLFILALAEGERGADRDRSIDLLRRAETVSRALPPTHIGRIGAVADLGSVLAADRQGAEGLVLLRQAGEALTAKLGSASGVDAGAKAAFEGWRRVYRLTVTAAWDQAH